VTAHASPPPARRLDGIAVAAVLVAWMMLPSAAQMVLLFAHRTRQGGRRQCSTQTRSGDEVNA